MSTGEVIASCWSTPGRSSWPDIGDCQTTIFSQGNLAVTLPRSGAWLGWGWYICPMFGRHLHTRECQLLMHWGEVCCGVGHMTSCIGPSLHMRGHLSWSDTPPCEACPSTWHQLSQDMIARLQIHGINFSFILPFLLLGLCHWLGLSFFESSPQLVTDSSHIFVHMLGRGASHEDLCAPKGGEVKVNWEPWPASKH